MPFRSPLPTALGLALLALGAPRAEDPFLGQIKEIKCVNCKPGWVTLVVHDPIDTRDFELYLKDSDYNRIIAPLPGKRIRDRDGQCFYWMERPKAAKPAGAKAPAQPAAAGAKGPDRKPAVAATAPKSGDTSATAAAAPDSSAPQTMAGLDNGVPPPSPENEGTPSACIRFYRQMN